MTNSTYPPGKPTTRQFNCEWPESEVFHLRHDLVRARRTLRLSRRLTKETATQSHLLSEAYLIARAERGEWLETVREARLRDRTYEPYKHLCFHWPMDTADLFEDDWEQVSLERHLLWGERFRLTRAHYILAAVRYGVSSIANGETQ